MKRLANAGLALLVFAAFLIAQSVFPPAGGGASKCSGLSDAGTGCTTNVGIQPTGTPSVGDVPTATSASAATWQAPAGGLSVSGYYLYDGANYYIGPNFRTATLPVDGNFSWVTTQGGASVASVGNALLLTAPGNNGNQVRARGLSMGANTQLTAAFAFTGDPADFFSGGIGLRESSTDKMQLFSLGTRLTTGNYSVRVEDWASQTGASTARFTGSFQSIVTGLVWFRIALVSTNIVASWSMDGTNFSTVFSEAQTVPFTTTPDQFVYFANVNKNGGNNAYTLLYSWAVQ